uniref:Retrotransposon gag domain-containing protein n=1 Tax=Phaseolus vulgaris TaxID=3885 RepID=V7ATA2_PHAVU|nr:hypothetical protein PHAVU_010G130400g [Phaseolus vulgaris]XP_007135449.1 hypothetical protein PHAVU_010G130400g [Phaseolus vulgaris]ESW07441.1 hypothetical protein PHAVU_010G130400g [Phaseolus vulgaris]ESW07443.1 hypothetical protein PHAVU_010G130400g [Phaseolus vulgaris]
MYEMIQCLVTLRQKTTVPEYHQQFASIVTRLHLSKSYMLSCFWHYHITAVLLHLPLDQTRHEQFGWVGDFEKYWTSSMEGLNVVPESRCRLCLEAHIHTALKSLTEANY